MNHHPNHPSPACKGKCQKAKQDSVNHCGQSDCHSHGHHHENRRYHRRGTFAVMALWDLGWKATAIAAAVRRGDKSWILPLALLNTVGVLPITYLVTRKEIGN